MLDIISFRYLLALAVHFSLEIFLMDVVTTYLYGNLDMQIYISPPPDLFPKLLTPSSGKFLGFKINKALYDLKQASRMWYHLFRDFLISHGFIHDPALPCIFTSSQNGGYVIVAVYVDNLNLIGTLKLCKHTEKLLTTQFDMKLFSKTPFCFGLQI